MTESDHDIGALAAAFKDSVELKDRKYHMKTFQQCFVGSEAVDYLLNSGEASNREDAVQIGKALAAMHLFEHVTRDHEFADEHLFFRFLGEGERGSLKIDGVTGEKIEWSKFLAPAIGDGTEGMQPSFSHGDLAGLADIDPKDNRVISEVWPMDSYNTTLLNHVHPPDWQDPKVEENDTYDMVVIGAGVGGLISAAGAAGVGAKVAMIEAHMLGGDCLNVGCVPSKAFIHSANMAHSLTKDVARMEEAGVFVDPNAVKVDFEKVMERVRKVRSQISHHDSATRYSKALGVEVFIGYGKFTSPKSVKVNGQTLNFKKAVIATGGYPTLIPMEGLKELHDQTTSPQDPSARPLVMTNETFFNMTQQPKNLVVIGAGVIGMELAQAMQRLGTQTTVLGRSGKVLPKEDVDMAAVVKQQMVDDGVTFLLSVKKYEKIELTGKIAESGNPEMAMTILEGDDNEPTILICDAVLVAAGRLANVSGMDLEKANVKYTPAGLVVNDKLQTTNSKVFGVGDVCSKFKFTHAADFMARAVIRNSLFFGKEKMSNLLIPYATFTSPEIASVGLYGKDLEKKCIDYNVIEKHFKDNDRAICDDTTQGFVRFRIDAKKDKILGATIVGEGAANMISEITLAMQSGTGLGSLATVIHPYPTTAEVLRQSGDVYNKKRLTTTVKVLLRGLVQLQK